MVLNPKTFEVELWTSTKIMLKVCILLLYEYPFLHLHWMYFYINVQRSIIRHWCVTMCFVETQYVSYFDIVIRKNIICIWRQGSSIEKINYYMWIMKSMWFGDKYIPSCMFVINTCPWQHLDQFEKKPLQRLKKVFF